MYERVNYLEKLTDNVLQMKSEKRVVDIYEGIEVKVGHSSSEIMARPALDNDSDDESLQI